LFKTQEFHIIFGLQATGVPQLTIVSFLLRLSFNSRGRPIPLKSLSKDESSLIEDFENVGLVVTANGNLFPTPLASSLVSTPRVQMSQSKQSSLILESNFHIYFYTTSSADVATVSLFSKIIVTLPNMVLSHKFAIV
jgi:hypothetical protein